jgi:hypothetical protein
MLLEKLNEEPDDAAEVPPQNPASIYDELDALDAEGQLDTADTST